MYTRLFMLEVLGGGWNRKGKREDHYKKRYPSNKLGLSKVKLTPEFLGIHRLLGTI